MTPNKKLLMQQVSYMQCKNMLEFKQRLQWLSEGMLRNHMESVIVCKADQEEIEIYRKYKEGTL